MRISFYIFTLLCAAGLYLSEQLVEIHVLASMGAADTGICASGAGFSCNDVARSALAEMAGIPIASIGFAFYLTALLMVFVRRFFSQLPLFAALPDVFVIGGLLSLLYSIFLGVMSSVVVGKLCPLCIGLYAVNLGLFLTAWFSHPDGGRSALKGALGILKDPALWATIVILIVTLPVANMMHARRAEAAQASQPKEPSIKEQKPEEIPTVTVVVGDSATRGVAEAPIEVVEFSDFECPYCRRLADSLRDASKIDPGLFRYTFKHFPMDSSCNRSMDGAMHEQACNAAIAMVCAGRLGRAWEMHDVLFENQAGLNKEAYVTFAAKIGVDVESFRACLDDPKALQRVKDDVDQGIKLGLDGTPTWFVNGIRQVGARPPAELVAIFQHLAKEKANPVAPAPAPAPAPAAPQ